MSLCYFLDITQEGIYMSGVAKHINIPSTKVIEENSFQYIEREILSPSDAYEMIRE